MRVLHVNIDNKNCGGAYFLVKNVEKYIATDIVFDFYTMDEFIVSENEELNPKEGSKVYSGRLRKNRLLGHILLPFSFYNALKRMKNEIVHIHTDSTWKAMLYAVPAKMLSKKVLIHAHATGVTGDCMIIKRILQKLVKKILVKYVDQGVACSSEAFEWIFGNSLQKHVIFNGIDTDKYRFSEYKRMETRRRWDIKENEIVLGNVGLLSELKNQSFIIDILKDLRDAGIQVKAVFVGEDLTGMKATLSDKAKEINMDEYIIFNGFSNDISFELSGMDLFLFPSLNEGFSLALLEAQANGIQCITSSNIPLISKVTEYVERLEIKSHQLWAKKIVEIVKKEGYVRTNKSIDGKYSIQRTARELEFIYRGVINEN